MRRVESDLVEKGVDEQSAKVKASNLFKTMDRLNELKS